MSKNSAVKIKATGFQKALNILSLFTIIGYLSYCLLLWCSMPEMIPRHFNALGEIDAYWSKNYFWFIPCLTIGIYLLLTICEFFPQSWNLPQNKKADLLTDKRNLHLAYSMMLWLKLECIIIFWLITYYTINNLNLPIYFLGVSMLILFATLGYYIYQIYRKTEGEKS